MKKNQTNLEIISRRENITARTIVKDNTVIFAYERADNQVNAVAFSVQRGTQGSPEFTGAEAFRGSLYGEAFNVENNAYHIGDSAIYDEIFVVCQQIIKPETSDGASV